MRHVRVFFWLIALFPVMVVAQGYPRLHVVALAQRTDRATVEPNGVFHVTIHVRITQHRERLDELILGAFENCEIISNETVRTVVPDGTDFVERLTVQALAPGDATISPAYLDAIDPALGKPMRFSSNALRVHVAGGLPIGGALHTLAETARRLLLAVAIVAGFFAAVFVLIVMFVRRKRRRPPAMESVRAPVVVPVAPAATTNERLARAAEAFRAERSASALVELRAILFARAGVASGATLVDALRALGERDRDLRAALLAAESVAFGPAADRATAGDAMLAAIQAYCERPAANEDVWIR